MSTIRTSGSHRRTPSFEERSAAIVRFAGQILVHAAVWLDEKMERRRSRRLLQELSDYQLKDIGITRAEAYREGQRPFWD